MSETGSRRARQRASALREATDAHQEAKETGDQAAFERRNRAMRRGTTSEEYRHMSEKLQAEVINENDDRKRRVTETGWRRRR